MNSTIAKLALQALVGRSRFVLLLVFPSLLLALTLLLWAMTGDTEAGWIVVGNLGYPVVLPLVAILAASAVLGPEVDDGSIVYLIAKPVNRHVVAFSKWVVAWAATLVAGVGGLFVVSLIAGGGERAAGWLVASTVAATVYTAVFLALSAVARHAVVVALLFILLWEVLLGALLSGVAWLSIGQWGLRVGHEISSELGDPVNLPWALLASLAVTAGALWFAGDRLRSFSLTGDE